MPPLPRDQRCKQRACTPADKPWHAACLIQRTLLVVNKELNMKKYLAIAACSLPMALAPLVYAQTSTPPSTGADGAAAPGSTAPAPTAPAPSTPPASGAPDSGTTGAGTPAPGAPATGAPAPGAPAAGDAQSGSAAMTEAITGWSVKDKIMGQAVYNEKNEKVGDVNDVVLASDGKAAYFLVGAGGFLGMGERDVAIPFQEITQMDNKLILQGYTKEQLKALPEVKVAE